MSTKRRKNIGGAETSAPKEMIRKKVKLGVPDIDRKKCADQYRRVGAVSMSFALSLVSMCMGETVAQMDAEFDAKAAELDEIRDLLATIESRSKRGEKAAVLDKQQKLYSPSPPRTTSF
jgi:hypothetical protein